jgi:hypothetical protein
MADWVDVVEHVYARVTVDDMAFSRRRASAHTAAGAAWSEVPALVVPSRQVRVAGISRTERVCLDRGTVRSPALQASLGVDCCRDPPRPAIVG